MKTYHYTTPQGKVVHIPYETLQTYIKKLDLTLEQAVETYLEDEGYLENEEQNHLCKVAKANKITQTIHGAGEKPRKKSEKPKTVKVSDEKKVLFAQILSNLQYDYENVEILKENKLIQVKIGEKVFKIDLIEQRQPKK